MAWARERLREAQQTSEEEERQNLEAYCREIYCMNHQEELEVHTSRGSGESRNNNQKIKRMYHREELEAHTSRGSRGSRNNNWEDYECSERAAAADYERNCHHENQLRRDEEAK